MIIADPIKKEIILYTTSYLLWNSWTKISLQATYTKVPPANAKIIEDTISGEFEMPNPIAIPIGSAKPKPRKEIRTGHKDSFLC